MKGVADFTLIKRILRYVIPYKVTFFVALFLTISLGGLSLARPILIMIAVDDYIVPADLDGLGRITILLVVLLVLEAFVQFVQSYMANWLGQTVIKDLRVEVFKHISKFRLKFFDNSPVGTLITRVISDIETIANVFSEGLLIIMGDLLKIVLVVAYMFFENWQLALFSLGTIPLLIISANVFRNGIKSAFERVRAEVSNINTFVQERIVGMSLVKLFNKEEEEAANFEKINDLHRAAHIKSIWYFSIFLPFVEILTAISTALMIYWGAGLVMDGELVMGEKVTPGILFAYILFINMLFRPIRQLADKFNTLQMGMVASDRVFKLLDTTDHIEDSGSISDEELDGEIKFKNVWFAYNDESWVLKNVSFEVEAGKSVAIVGATGAGKTSIVNILCRYYEFQKGDITLDGLDLRDYKIKDIRSNVGLVLQDVFLFSDTIHNNITLNDPSITREQVIEAAKTVGAHRFIDRLEGGYDYEVMERGNLLSVGQRQLISFIRAYVYNPKILILDEATSSIDVQSEEMIQAATAKLTEGRTSIIIAHRLSTIRNVDKIIVLDHGEIIEQGNHDELLKKEGYYYKLFKHQFSSLNE
ncbi:MAG: ABC transporter ATP-binding protein [Flavobacteriales bacterium]|nr:ABC transporter ATP-binding protein [Flavobacteriales bacterium]